MLSEEEREALRVYHQLSTRSHLGRHGDGYRRAASALREGFSSEMEKELHRRERLAAAADAITKDIAASDAGFKSIKEAFYIAGRLRDWARGDTPPTAQPEAAVEEHGPGS